MHTLMSDLPMMMHKAIGNKSEVESFLESGGELRPHDGSPSRRISKRRCAGWMEDAGRVAVGVPRRAGAWRAGRRPGAHGRLEQTRAVGGAVAGWYCNRAGGRAFVLYPTADE